MGDITHFKFPSTQVIFQIYDTVVTEFGIWKSGCHVDRNQLFTEGGEKYPLYLAIGPVLDAASLYG